MLKFKCFMRYYEREKKDQRKNKYRRNGGCTFEIRKECDRDRDRYGKKYTYEHKEFAFDILGSKQYFSE